VAGATVKPMSDPTINEIHAIRAAKASNDDLRKIAEAARSRQAAGGRKVMNLRHELRERVEREAIHVA
jgi:hypothetical protein